MDRGDVLGWNDDVRQLPGRLRRQAGKVGADCGSGGEESRRRNPPHFSDGTSAIVSES
jgi:hypothetical protein